MYARFRPCDAKLGSGILTVAAAAAPPAAAWGDGQALVRAQTGESTPCSSTAHVQMTAHSSHASKSMRRSRVLGRLVGRLDPRAEPFHHPRCCFPGAAAAAPPSGARRSSSLCVTRCALASSSSALAG